MYRKHLKMARGEGDTPLKSNFVERVVKLPMVNVVWDYATNTYSHIKESNKLVNFTLTNAERTATFVAGQAKPVVLKFEKQIQAVDDLACKGLVTLEEKVPFIKKPANEIILDTRKMYSNTVNSRLENIKKYGNDTVKSAADFGLKRANAIFGPRIVQSVLSSVDGVLVVTQNYIDNILPPTKEESQNNGSKQQESESPTGLTRVLHISSTVRRRAYRMLLLKLESAQERAFDLLLTHPIRLIEFSKTHLDAVAAYAIEFWSAIQKQKAEDSDASERTRVDQQLLQLARIVSRQVAATYTSVFPSNPKPAENDTSQEPSQAPVAISAVRDSVLWVIGMLKIIPQLLPMYIYGLASWLEGKRNSKQNESLSMSKNEGVKENGATPSDHNNIADHSYVNSNTIREDYCREQPSRIPEENEQHS